MKGKIYISESEKKHILNKHTMLINEDVKVSDIIKGDMDTENKNFKYFIEFLNGNVSLNDIATDMETYHKKTNKVKDVVAPIAVSTDTEETDIELGSVTGSDEFFYKSVLKEIGAEPTTENMKFFQAWRQSEGAKAKFNPFNTTQPMKGSTFYNCLKREGKKCKGGVRNYQSESDGIKATAKTLTNGYYPCILNGLKNNIGAKKISEKCLANLKTWGTGGLIKTVLASSELNPPDISRSEVKTVT